MGGADRGAAMAASIARAARSVRMSEDGIRGLSRAHALAPDPVRLVALAERLDHLRHAHLRDAGHEWRALVHAEAEAIYLPVAMRTHPRLTQRYQHWCSAFGRRLERE